MLDNLRKLQRNAEQQASNELEIGALENALHSLVTAIFYARLIYNFPKGGINVTKEKQAISQTIYEIIESLEYTRKE